MFSGESEDEVAEKVSAMKGAVTSDRIDGRTASGSQTWCWCPGVDPVTTSGKVQRRACADQYVRSQFRRIG